MNESDLTRRLKSHLRGFWHRNHGSPTVSGFPDLEGVIGGISHVIEVKKGHITRDDKIRLEHYLTQRQLYNLSKYKENEAKALLGVYLTDRKKWIFMDFENRDKDFSDIELEQRYWEQRLLMPLKPKGTK